MLFVPQRRYLFVQQDELVGKTQAFDFGKYEGLGRPLLLPNSDTWLVTNGKKLKSSARSKPGVTVVLYHFYMICVHGFRTTVVRWRFDFGGTLLWWGQAARPVTPVASCRSIFQPAMAATLRVNRGQLSRRWLRASYATPVLFSQSTFSMLLLRRFRAGLAV